MTPGPAARARAGRPLVAASWFGAGLLVGTLIRSDQAEANAPRMFAAFNGQEVGLDVRMHKLAAAAAASRTRPRGDVGDPAWLFTVKLADGFPGELSVDRGDAREVVTSEHFESVLVDVTSFATRVLKPRAAAERAAALQFLVGARAGDGLGTDLELAENVASVHELLRDPLPTTEILPDARCTLRVERVIEIDERAFWLSGWIHDAAPRDGRLTLIAPEGERVQPLEGAVSFGARPDVEKAFGDGDETPSLGFQVYIETERPSLVKTGWVVQLRTAAGEAVEDPARSPVVRDTDEVRDLIHEPLRSEDPEPTILANQVLAALTRVSRSEHAAVERIVDYGRPPSSPEISIVIPVVQLDRIPHQLIQFELDPELVTAELIYVAPASSGGALRKRGPQWHELYRVPFRVVEVSDGARRAQATNLGAAVARGRLLLITTADVFPLASGWLGALREVHDNEPRVGAVAPRLLNADGSIAHAGSNYVRNGETGLWERSYPLRGLSVAVPAAREVQRVDAVSDTCMMIASDAFSAHEGLSDAYLDDGDAAGELCLRLADDGLGCLRADLSLYWLERTRSWPEIPSPAAARFNNWLFTRRRGAQLDERRAAAHELVTIHEQPAQIADPRTGSEAPAEPVEILEVIRSDRDESWLVDAKLQRPQPGTELEPYANTYSFSVEGWALARDGAPVKVELHDGARVVGETVTKVGRDDVADQHPSAAGVDAAGFQTAVSTLGLSPRFTLSLDLVSSDGKRARMAAIRGRRRMLATPFAPTLQPAIITTLGRTGSSWLALVLSKHPEVVAYRPFQYEARVASYWMEILHALSAPDSYMQSVRPELYQGHWWIGDERPGALPLLVADSLMPQWLGRGNVESLAAFCQSRLDAFYSKLAENEGSDRTRYFAEKCFPDELTPRLLSELYADGREILLVRDFRDMVCSILGFNAKRGFASFGREATSSDEEFIRYLRVSALRMLESFNDRGESAYLLRYEDLIREPETALTGLFQHLGIESDPGTVKRTIDEALVSRPHVQRAHQTSASVAGSVGRWRQELSPSHQQICDEAFGDILEAFGYAPTFQTSSNERSATISSTASGVSASSS